MRAMRSFYRLLDRLTIAGSPRATGQDQSKGVGSTAQPPSSFVISPALRAINPLRNAP